MQIELAGISELLLYAVLMILGAIMAVVVPYLLNAWVDPTIKVNWVYVAILFFAVCVAVLFSLPSKVDIINLDAVKAAILSGYGLQAFVAKVVKSIVEKQQQGQVEGGGT